MFTPTTIQQKTIDLFVKKKLSYFLFNENEYFYEYKNEHFDYYIFEYKPIIDYSINLTFDDLIEDYKTKKYNYRSRYEHASKTKKMVRFSRTYGTLECYWYDYSFKKPKYLLNTDTDVRVLIAKKNKLLTIRHNGHVLLGGNRYISLKNFRNNNFADLSYTIELLNSHLNSSFTQNDLHNLELMIPNKFSKNCSCLEDVLKNMLKKPVAKILIQKYELKDLLCLYLMINEYETPKIISFIKENLDLLNVDESNLSLDIKTLYNSNNWNFRHKIILPILAKYMAIKLNLAKPLFIPEINSRALVPIKQYFNDIILLKDYLNISYDLGEKININITSTKRLKLIHDEFHIKLLLRKPTPKITVDKKFIKYFRKINPEDLERNKLSVHLITTSKELRIESIEMNHCVANYHSNINKKQCCIWKVKDNETNEKATLQIDDYYGTFKPVQFKGIWNTEPSKQLKEKLNNILMSLQTPLIPVDVIRGGMRRVEEIEANLPF